ncbi:potassium channel [Plasmodium gonderi]|uniref:Potassium channel n=1 Tax=Plasmodium gonderi TaxID=77519 RepID=A0A1Y1JQ72_PLAGO|nr:potassium channel [Plasmodium gonderi]GAW83648.1 potassium channel [Plasmodium gonderi]
MLCLLIVILILYASIDISTNYGPVIIVYIIVLEFGSMLISYILLQFPFFYRILKNIFTRARNINKYSHQYKPFYYDSPSNSDDKDSISIERGKKKRRNTFALFTINRNNNKRYSVKNLFMGYNKSKREKKEKKNDKPDDSDRLANGLLTNVGSGQSKMQKNENNILTTIGKNRNNDDNGNNYKRQSIYLDDCNMWMNSDMKKVNKKKNFNFSKSLSFNINLNEDNDMMLKDSASFSNIKIFLGHRSSKFVPSKSKIKSIKSSIYNKYVPLTFTSSYKNNMVTQFLKAHTENIQSGSSEYTSSCSEEEVGFNKNRYKKVCIQKCEEKRNNGKKMEISDQKKEEDEHFQKRMICKEIKSHSKEGLDIRSNLYTAKSAILFSNKKKKRKYQYEKLIRGRTRYFRRMKCLNKIKKLFYFFINYNMKSSKTRNNLFLFFRGISLYIKHQFVHYMSYEPVWIIAILIRIVMWCIVWLWAASYMERKPKNYQITEWNMKNVPSLYGYIECTFQWCGVFDYFFGLYFTNNKLKYIFSFFSLIDFITTPVSSLIMNFMCENKYSQNYWFLILGPLRFLRLVRAESTISSCFFWLSDVKIIIIGIIILALAILFTFSGIMYILEAPDIERDFVTPLDFIYFGVITMSTVGYGDYTPVTPAGKYLTMFIIITCISFVGAQFKRLKEAMFSPKTIMGIIPKQDDDYILILGPVSPTQLLYICKAINNSFPNSVESIFLFTPLPVIIYRFVYGSIVKNTNIKVCINGGNECFICPSIIYDAVINARALYILNNVDSEKYTLQNQQIFLASNNLNFNNNDQSQRISSNDIIHNNIINKFNGEKTKKWKYSDIFSEYKNEINKNNMHNLEMNMNINDSHFVKERDDQECLLRFIGTYNICNTLIPITLQLSNNTYEELIKSMNVYNYLSMEELKYALLAKSINCKGLFFLIINFFYKPKAVKSLKKYIIDLKLLMYNRILKRKNREKMNNAAGNNINSSSEMSSSASGMSFNAMDSDIRPMKKSKNPRGNTFRDRQPGTFNRRSAVQRGSQKRRNKEEKDKKSDKKKGKNKINNSEMDKTEMKETEMQEVNRKGVNASHSDMQQTRQSSSSESEGEKKNKVIESKENIDSIYQNGMFLLKSMEEVDVSHSPSYRNYYHMLERVSLNMYYYLEGLKYNIYRFQFPECMRGFLFQTATEYLYQKYSAFLIGIITINKEIFLNPSDYIIGEENKFYYTSAFSGIILTTSLDNLIKLSSIKNISKKVYEYNDRRISERFHLTTKSVPPRSRHKGEQEQKEEGMHHSCDNENDAREKGKKKTYSKRGKVNFRQNDDESITSPDVDHKGEENHNDNNGENNRVCKNNREEDDPKEGKKRGRRTSDPEEGIIRRKSNLFYNFILGIYEIDNYISAYRDIFTDKNKPLLLVCGWPDNIHMFLKHLQMRFGSCLRHKGKKMRRCKQNRNRNRNRKQKQNQNQNQEHDQKQNQKQKQRNYHTDACSNGESSSGHGDCSSSSEDSGRDSVLENKMRRNKKKIRMEMKYNMIILSLHVPKFNYENDIFNFSDSVAFIRGSALNSTNLIQAGLFYAKRLVIFNANHSLFIDKDAYRIDNEVIIIKNIIYQLYNTVLKNKYNYLNLIKKIFKKEFKDENINEKVFSTNMSHQLNEMIKVTTCSSSLFTTSCASSPTTSSASSSDRSPISSNTSSSNYSSSNRSSNSSSYIQQRGGRRMLNIFNTNRNPYLICLIKNSESLEYIDGSINLSYENYNDNEKMNKIWENCGEYIYTFELVSANIFVDEMLHNLVSFSLPISKYAIEYSVIYSLLGIDINEYSKNAKAFHQNLKLSTGQVSLIPIPSYFYKKSFYKCFSYFLHNKQCLCIGILRYMDISPLSRKSRKLFVLSCPSRTMKIEQDDQAYVISNITK